MEREQGNVSPTRTLKAAGVLFGVTLAAIAFIRGSVESFVLQVALIGLVLGVLIAVPWGAARRSGHVRPRPGGSRGFDPALAGLWVSFGLSVFVGALGTDFRGDLLYWAPALLVVALPAVVGAWWEAGRVEREA